MVARDKTSKFFELVAKYADKVSTDYDKRAPASYHAANPNTSVAQVAEISLVATRVDSAIRQIASEITKLKELAKIKTLFDDHTAEVQQKTYDLKRDLTSASQDLDLLDKLVLSSNNISSDDNVSHHRAVVATLRSKFVGLSKDFREALEIRTRTLQQQEMRRRVYQSPPSSTNVGNYDQRRATASSFDEDSIRNVSENTATLGFRSNLDQDLESGLQIQIQAPTQNSHYYQSRVDAVEQVQRVLGELAQAFQRVATLVGQQEEMVLRIDAQVDDSLHSLKEGQAQLLRYFQTISSNRSLILKVFGILIACAMFFIIFLA